MEHSYKTDSNNSFRQRCKKVVLKSEGYTAKDIAVILGSNMASVYNWLTRYDAAGIAGLRTRPGQGRKPILAEEHISIVRAAAVEQARQRLSQARQIIEENTGKKMSQETLTRFLKVITAVTSE